MKLWARNTFAFSQVPGIIHDFHTVCVVFKKGAWSTSCSQGAGDRVAQCSGDTDTNVLQVYFGRTVASLSLGEDSREPMDVLERLLLVLILGQHCNLLFHTEIRGNA